VLRDIDTGEIHSCADQEGYTPISRGLDLIGAAKQLVGHNTINFDYRALKKVYPGLSMRSDCDTVDTLILSRVLWPELEPVDDQKFSHIDKKYKGRHSLAAWGERLGVSKIKFKETTKKDPDVDNVWDKWTQEMQIYCEGDTLVTLKLYEYLSEQHLDPRCHELEHAFAQVMSFQEEFGFPFNEKAAFALVNTLKVKRAELDEQLQEVFPPLTEERISAKTGRILKSKVTVFNESVYSVVYNKHPLLKTKH
jgi:DNA polymerase I-like protein with 3'-5' exonuclease and polymerase domains